MNLLIEAVVGGVKMVASAELIVVMFLIATGMTYTHGPARGTTAPVGVKASVCAALGFVLLAVWL